MHQSVMIHSIVPLLCDVILMRHDATLTYGNKFIFNSHRVFFNFILRVDQFNAQGFFQSGFFFFNAKHGLLNH